MSEDATTTARAAPVPDQDSAPYWSGLREHLLLMPACASCGRSWFPAMPTCPACRGRSFDWQPVEASGRVYSWIAVHRPVGTVTADELPYLLATVEFANGCRLVGAISGDAIEIGATVDGVFVDHDTWTELRFRPREQR